MYVRTYLYNIYIHMYVHHTPYKHFDVDIVAIYTNKYNNRIVLYRIAYMYVYLICNTTN